MEINLASIRQEYTKGGLRESELPDNPFLLFSQWLQEAIDSKVDEPTAMLVGTVSPEGKPSTRTVLLKDLQMISLFSTPTTKAEKAGNWHKTRQSLFRLYGIN